MHILCTYFMPFSHLPFTRRGLLLGLMLVLWTLCCVFLVGFRIWRTQSYLYLSLLWNLALAWVPMITAFLMFWTTKQRLTSPVGQGLLFLIWFFFFPNAPYLITDLIHLSPRFGIPVWYDLMLMVFCAWTGVTLACGSLHLMQQVVSIRWGPGPGWLLVGLTIPAASFGIYLGRFLDWNSWDLVLHPRSILQHILSIGSAPLADPTPLGVSILLSVFLIMMYGTIILVMDSRVADRLPAGSIPEAGHTT